jgi:hypothetical protein
LQTHFTLLAGSRAVLLLQHFGKEEDKAWILPNYGAVLEETLAKALKERPAAAIRVVVDSKGLDLRRESLPPVDLVRRQKILGQQATHLFPKSLLRGAGSWRDGHTFNALHAATGNEPHLDALLQEVHKLTNPVETLAFFAAEWTDYAAQMRVNIPKPWSIALVLSEAMGLRQIVLKEGKPAFTRLHEDCAPSVGAAALPAILAQHLASTREYLPRLEPGAPKNAPALLFVPSCLESLAEHPDLKALDCRVHVLKTDHAALLPPEWEGDIVWASHAAEQKLPLVPLMPFWLKERVGRNRLRQAVTLMLMAFGFAGIYTGSTIMFTPKHQEYVPVPPMEVEEPAPAPKAEAPPAPDLKLDAFIYNSPDDWSVWINGKKFTAAAPEGDDLRVTDISADGVAVRWSKDGAQKDYLLKQENAASGKVQ